MTYRDEPWHKECFVCTGCKTPLAGQQFTSQDDNPYCIKCFGNLYAKKCSACTKPITGEQNSSLRSPAMPGVTSVPLSASFTVGSCVLWVEFPLPTGKDSKETPQSMISCLWLALFDSDYHVL